MDRLFQSHVELCAALRMAGRQILRFDRQDDQSLGKIREALKRADIIRETLRIAHESPEALENTFESPVATPTPDPEFTSDQATNDVPIRKSHQRKVRLTHPRSLRIVRFPAG
jgi:lysyl-tRNA synthetase class II